MPFNLLAFYSALLKAAFDLCFPHCRFNYFNTCVTFFRNKNEKIELLDYLLTIHVKSYLLHVQHGDRRLAINTEKCECVVCAAYKINQNKLLRVEEVKLVEWIMVTVFRSSRSIK